jgi:2-polyprenyl-3-methyl-5-hydroxy-6-metoxy-1,4-benzoquinol methylase
MPDQMTGLLSPFLRRRRIAAVGPYLRAGSVLDIGCGVGELAKLIESDRYLGVDLDRASIEIARADHPKHRFETLIEFESRKTVPSFDVISALALIEHLRDPGAWLLAIGAWLKSNGMIIITTPHPSMRWIHELGARVRLFSQEAAEEHEAMLDYNALETIVARAELQVTHYRRFLLGCNQLVVIKRLTEPDGTGGSEARLV